MSRFENTTFMPAPVQDLALLLARIGLGVVLIGHGWQKHQDGISSVADGFGQLGIPAPEAAAWFATYVEVAGGALLIVGLLTRLVGLLVVGDMAGAFWFVHRDGGIFVTDGGWELVVMIALLGLALAAVGPGRLSVDHLFVSRRRGGRRRATATPRSEPVDA